MKTVLVTGANGFIGWRLCERLAHQWNVRAVVRKECHFPFPCEIHFLGNIGPETDWQHALRDAEVVVHLAARGHVMREDAADPLAMFRKANVEASLALARMAAAKGVKRFVFVSSVKVNGESTLPGIAFQPDDKPTPQDAYAVSKWEAEQLLMQLGRDTGMEIIIIRPPLVYGPGVKGNFAAMIRWTLKGIPLPLGAIRNQRSLIALDNLVDFIALCVDCKKSAQAANQVFLVSDGEDVSTTELLHRIAYAHGRQTRLLPVPMRWLRRIARLLRKEAIADRLLGSLVVDSSKARDMLEWQPVVSMNEQLQKMARNAESF